MQKYKNYAIVIKENIDKTKMSENIASPPDNIPEDALKLSKLIPGLADQERVEASVAHAEKSGVGVRANHEQKIGAHLTRLTRLLEREGVEPRVWDSAEKELLIKPEDVPDGYWKKIVQVHRDEGYGDIILDQREKKGQVNMLQEMQSTGLDSWRTYLESSGKRYPVWFKFYVWDGMSRLGTFNKEKEVYNKRSKGTVASYPQLNTAALEKVFDAVKDKGGDDETVKELVENGSFNKLYSHMLLEVKAIIPTPEHPEDVHGEWRVYTGGDIQALTAASEATPWCIAGKTMAERYTIDGGRFLLFHLQDPQTGKVSPTAAASIRLDHHGEVVEMSGLKGGSSQYLEDALIPTVREKVRTLPRGETFLQAYDDRQTLIAMDRKFQKGEPFTREELIFLYEAERPIGYIYYDLRESDSRIKEFRAERQKHISQLSESENIDLKEAELMLLPAKEIAINLHGLLEKGYNPTVIANRISPIVRLDYLSTLLEAGAKIDLQDLYDQLNLVQRLEGFSELVKHGAHIDADELAAQFTPVKKIKNFDSLIQIGAKIDPSDISDSLDMQTRFKMLPELVEIGADIDVEKLLRELQPDLSKSNYIDFYIEQGANPVTVMGFVKVNLGYRSTHLEQVAGQLINSGLSSDEVMSLILSSEKVDSFGRKENLDDSDHLNSLLKAGVDPNSILKSGAFSYYLIEQNMSLLLSAGANTSEIMNALGAYTTSRHILELLEAGSKVRDIVLHIKPKPVYLLLNLELLNQNGANLSIEDVVQLMDPNDILSYAVEAVEQGAKININDLLDDPKVDKVSSDKISGLLSLGADPKKIAQKVDATNVGFSPIDGRWYSTDADYLSRNHPDIYKLAYERITGQKIENAA